MRAAPERTAPGVGQLSIADSDVVEESNLQRQIIHKESSVGSSKAVSAASACMALNSRIRAAPLPSVTAANVAEMVHARPAAAGALRSRARRGVLATQQTMTHPGQVTQHDLILDCTDSVAARYMLSDAAAAASRPLVSGAAVGFEGQLMVLCGRSSAAGGSTPCYRCLFPQPPSSCARCADAGAPAPCRAPGRGPSQLRAAGSWVGGGLSLQRCCETGVSGSAPATKPTRSPSARAGVMGAVPGVIGCLQALEGLKILTRVSPAGQRTKLAFPPQRPPASPRRRENAPRRARTPAGWGAAGRENAPL